MHPLVNEIEKLSESEIEQKINDLSKKYYMTRNFQLQEQIIMVLEDYRAALSKKQQAALQAAIDNRNKGLDKLINID